MAYQNNSAPDGSYDGVPKKSGVPKMPKMPAFPRTVRESSTKGAYAMKGGKGKSSRKMSRGKY